jgi:hypothetical protein
MCKCKKLLQDYANWCRGSAGWTTNYAAATLVSHDAAYKQLVTFTLAALVLDASGTVLTNLDANGKIALLRPPNTQLFSDRITSGQPFSMVGPTVLGVSLVIETGRLMVRSLTYPNHKAVAELRCANNTLYGFYGPGGEVSANGAVSLTLSKQSIDNSPPR